MHRERIGACVMDEQKGHRRSVRIRGANYAEPGAYFVTICADQRRTIFGRIEEGQVILTPLGEIVRECWVGIPQHFPNATLKEFVVMPNHLHGIIVLGARHAVAASVVGARFSVQGLQVQTLKPDAVPSDETTRTPESFQKPVRGSIPTIIRSFKSAVSHETRMKLSRASANIW